MLEEQGNYDKPRVWNIFPAGWTEDDRILVRLSDGTPFLVERQVGKGRCWLTPSAADTAWTDWPLTGTFAPLAQSGVDYLATGTGLKERVEACGNEIYWPMPPDAAAEVVEVTDPLGNQIPAVPQYHSGHRVWTTSETLWPGHYILEGGDEHHVAAAVAIPLSESLLSQTAAEIEGLDGAVLNPLDDSPISCLLYTSDAADE